MGHATVEHSLVDNSRLITYLVSQLLALNNGMLLHAAAVVKDKKAFLFLGIAGSGKSTIAALSRRYTVLGDDVIIIRRRGKSYYALPTPWRQQPFIKFRKGRNAKIAAIFFIKKFKEVRFSPLASEAALANMLASHIHFLSFTEGVFLRKVFSTASGLVKAVPAYEMEFGKESDFWPELEEAVDGA
jgi:hypothetical protein